MKMPEIIELLGVDRSLIEKNKIRVYTLAYLLYWLNRINDKEDIFDSVLDRFLEYTRIDKRAFSKDRNKFINEDVFSYLKDNLSVLVPYVSSIDLVVENENNEVLLYTRKIFPGGLALPGGILGDEDDEIGGTVKVLREKVFCINEDLLSNNTEEGVEIFNQSRTILVFVKKVDRWGYKFSENLESEIRPCDPRHLVRTTALKCKILRGADLLTKEFIWISKHRLLMPEKNKLVFNHHKEIIFHTLAKSDLDSELMYEDETFVRGIIDDPLKSYLRIKERFEKNSNNPNTTFPELYPIVNKMLSELYKNSINYLCERNPYLNGFRDKITIDLRHVLLKNRVFCPYLPTIKAIFGAVAFFDVIAREKDGFYSKISYNSIHEHNPRELIHSSYHMYRYKYRLDDLYSMIPNEILIPTFCSLSATDLLKTRCVPVRFIGLSLDFIYVDEFEQSPEEFLMHDCNHTWRMINEDNEYCKSEKIKKLNFYKDSYKFSHEYLGKIKIRREDKEYDKELKKLKKIIIFEIVHEDARPFTKDMIVEYLSVKEGGEVRFEVPYIDPVTKHMDIVDTLDTGISTLSYVRNKLQYGFYDQVDSQLPQIVAPEYRKSKYITLAAIDIFKDLGISSKKTPTYDWLLKRTCAVGPDNVHNTTVEDEEFQINKDKIEKLNPKRYQA